MANVLPRDKRIAVPRALVNGNSERAVSELADVNARTVARLAVEFGTGASRLHDVLARDLTCTEIECDEIWSYVGKKQAHVKPEDAPEMGEAYTFVGLDRDSRFAISFRVGKRDQASTDAFMADLRARLVLMPTISTGRLRSLLERRGRRVRTGRRLRDHDEELPRRASAALSAADCCICRTTQVAGLIGDPGQS